MNIFAVVALIVGFTASLSTSAEAQQKDSILLPLMHPPKNQKPSDSDLLVLVNSTKVPLKVAKNLAGDEVFLFRSNTDYSRNAAMCIIADGASYPDLSAEAVHEVLSVTLTPWLNRVITIKKPGLGLDYCLDAEGNLKDSLSNYPEIMIIERKFMPALEESNDYKLNYKKYLQAGLISKEFFFDSRGKYLASIEDVITKQRAELTQLDDAANNQNDTKLGILVMSTPDNKVNLCAVSDKRFDTPYLLGYSFNYIKYLPQNWASEVREKNPWVKFEETKFYAKTFTTLDEFYLHNETDPSACNLFVGTPKQIQTVRAAKLRDTGQPLNLIGALVNKSELADSWAVAVGFQNFAQHQLAEKIDAKADVIKELVKFGINSEASFLEARAQMQVARYASSDRAVDVLDYLRNKKIGEKEGKTAVIVKNEREKQERVQAEQRSAEKKKAQQEYAKKFPFTAVISCSMGESSLVNLNACFVSKYNKTELEIQNGNDYKMYTIQNLQSAGQMTEQGLEVPLRKTFSIVTQNAAENLMLTVTIFDNSSGKTAFMKSAGQYGVIKISN